MSYATGIIPVRLQPEEVVSRSIACGESECGSLCGRSHCSGIDRALLRRSRVPTGAAKVYSASVSIQGIQDAIVGR